MQCSTIDANLSHFRFGGKQVYLYLPSPCPTPTPPEKSTKFKGLTDKAKIRRLQGVALKGQKTKDQKKKSLSS